MTRRAPVKPMHFLISNLFHGINVNTCKLRMQVLNRNYYSPNLNFAASVAQNGKSRYGALVVPFILMAQFITSIKYKVNWQALDYRKDIIDITVPILMLHTKNDSWVPIYVSQELADEMDNIKLVEIPNGNHCKGWNADKDLYENSVTDFLSKT